MDALNSFRPDSFGQNGVRRMLQMRDYEIDADAVALAILMRLKAERVWFVSSAGGELDDEDCSNEDV